MDKVSAMLDHMKKELILNKAFKCVTKGGEEEKRSFNAMISSNSHRRPYDVNISLHFIFPCDAAVLNAWAKTIL
jgi:hypothetical protein